jgi:hypothetical protein
VYERSVDLLVCSLPLQRHSYIGFILVFASSFHNKQPKYTSSICSFYEGHYATLGLLFIIYHKQKVEGGVVTFHYRRAAFSSQVTSNLPVDPSGLGFSLSSHRRSYTVASCKRVLLSPLFDFDFGDMWVLCLKRCTRNRNRKGEKEGHVSRNPLYKSSI